MFEHRPEKEGIKTSRDGWLLAISCLNTDLKKKGLRRIRPADCNSRSMFEHRPEKEGIKTGVPKQYASSSPFEHRPEKEGIKTPVIRAALHFYV